MGGLDMTAVKVKGGSISKPVDFVLPDDSNAEELHYWRKHPNLHGWMERLYHEKDGQEQNFNCCPVQITLEDLDTLEKDVTNKDLPETSGFFFGESSDEDQADDLEFIEKARQAINNGHDVYYTSWW